MAFKDTLRRLMNEKNMKAADLARATGLSEAIISTYLSGKKEPLGKTSIAIAKALQVTLDVLWETDFADEQSVDSMQYGEIVLVDKYRQLNTDGQARLQEHADLLMQSGMYTTKRPPLPTPEETAAELEELSIQNPLRAMIRDESS